MAGDDVGSGADQIVLDLRAVEDYVRDAKLALVNALGFLALVGTYAAARVVVDAPVLPDRSRALPGRHPDRCRDQAATDRAA